MNFSSLLQQHIPICFSVSNDIRALAVQNEANGRRTRNGSGRGKELPDTLRSCSIFVILPRNYERTACSKGRRKERKLQKLAQAATERRRKDRGKEEGGDENDDEQYRTFYSLDSALSSAQLRAQHITAPLTIATHPFSPFLHSQLSAPSVLVGTPPEPLAHSSPATYFSSLAQKSLDIT
ncbi:uncharacterized protein MONOS_12045 [Monocercomonoides exilis]|uniref:uncharacterized protein n=1 Tax=Monocercomonoides exilis TaxID=2049356 RepID=UPI00355AA3AD|nr:hypothetical protein MONOS_12045 [Monocercomonoides exilis]|eukprot:MONOS_12045.1-p1 / transcript=MONOS_12045.1 / gene=MONOS_12045 / organism=Monocercomonoides_exilis_PA203 / gene_product=unspecified product / transcript_product=unspecified product / location=Mono_scaffold00639:25986-26640(+) / protein_length=180 / sequence_SO=supercontig / SO=protein_coding / is_pseudo=false